MKLRAVEQQAIQRFCDENNCKPALSIFPMEVNFTHKETKAKITKTLLELVNHHEESNKEESSMRKDEKKRSEQEAKREEIRKRYYGGN